MSEQAGQMIELLKSIDASLKTLVARKNYVRTDKGFSLNGDAGAKPCIACALARSCKSPCGPFDAWKIATGLSKAKPGHVEKKA